MALEVIAEHFLVLLYRLGAELPAVQREHVVRSDEGGVEGHSEHLDWREGEAAVVFEDDHDVAVNAELARQFEVDPAL